jgi:hypothetical protein
MTSSVKSSRRTQFLKRSEPRYKIRNVRTGRVAARRIRTGGAPAGISKPPVTESANTTAIQNPAKPTTGAVSGRIPDSPELVCLSIGFLLDLLRRSAADAVSRDRAGTICVYTLVIAK